MKCRMHAQKLKFCTILSLIARMTFPTLLLLILVGCAKPTEEQRLANFRSSIKYKAYRFSSEKAVRLAIVEYNKTTSQPLDENDVHSTLALIFFISENNEYSFIEADVTGAADNNDSKVFSLCMKSVALARMKYPGLSKRHYDELKQALAAANNGDANSIETDHKLLLISVIAVSLYHGDPDLAKFGADALGAISQLDYLPPLIGAVVEAKKGNPLTAVSQLKELNKSERFSEHKKVLIAEVTDIMENSACRDKLGEEITCRIITKLVKRVLDDVFTAENKKAMLAKVSSLSNTIVGKKQPSASFAGDASTSAPPIAENPANSERRSE